MIELPGFIEIMLQITFFVLIIGVLAVLIRFIIGPTIWDRILMVNLLSITIMMLVVVYAMITGSVFMLDMALVLGLTGFLTITLLSNFIMSGGREK